jgi:hypothetical protein
LDRYIHLQRDRWLHIKPTKLTEAYYTDEPDNKGKSLKGREHITYVHDIVISITRPK